MRTIRQSELIKKYDDKHAVAILSSQGYLKRDGKPCGTATTYEVLRELPELDHYLDIRVEHFRSQTITKLNKAKKLVTKIQLRNLYDHYATNVLVGAAVVGIKEFGSGKVSYKILTALPSYSDYLKLRYEHYKCTVGSLISDAFSEVESLKDEMESWYDNLPESFQNNDKGCRIQDAANALENLSEPDVSDALAEVKTVHLPMIKCDSRSDRAAEAASQLEDALQVLQEARDDIDALIQELDTAKSDLEGVDFPGMYD